MKKFSFIELFNLLLLLGSIIWLVFYFFVSDSRVQKTNIIEKRIHDTILKYEPFILTDTIKLNRKIEIIKKDTILISDVEFINKLIAERDSLNYLLSNKIISDNCIDTVFRQDSFKLCYSDLLNAITYFEYKKAPQVVQYKDKLIYIEKPLEWYNNPFIMFPSGLLLGFGIGLIK